MARRDRGLETLSWEGPEVNELGKTGLMWTHTLQPVCRRGPEKGRDRARVVALEPRSQDFKLPSAA